MNWVDAAIVTVVGASTALGIYWGIIRQLISILGLVGGVYFAGRFYSVVAGWLGRDGLNLTTDPNWARVAGFVIVLVLVGASLGVIGTALRFVTRILFLGWLDHFLGGVLGFVVSVFFVMTALVVVTVFPVGDLSEAVKDSVLAQWLAAYVPVVLAMLPPEFAIFRENMGLGPY